MTWQSTDGLTETVRVMTRTDGNADEMGEPQKTWTPVDVPGCLVHVLYRDANADASEPIRPDADELTVYVAMDSSLIDFRSLRGAKLRFPARFAEGELEANELHVVGISWPTPQSPLTWDMTVKAVVQHG